MIARMNEKGFTLLELLAVFAIIFIILTFTVPKVLATINNSKTEADIANLDSLNRATEQYRFFLELENESVPADLTQQTLLEGGFINDILEPLSNDKEFFWDSSLESWSYIEKGTGTNEGFVLYDEDTVSYYFEDGVLVPDENQTYLEVVGVWGEDENNPGAITVAEGEEATFSVQHNIEGSYTILLDAEADDPGSSANVKGVKYGVFFESISTPQSYSDISSGFLFEVSYGKDTVVYSFTDIDNDLLLWDLSKSYDNNLSIHIKIDVIDGGQIEINLSDKDGDLDAVKYPDSPNVYSIKDEETHSGIVISRGNGENANAIFYDIQIKPYQ